MQRLESESAGEVAGRVDYETAKRLAAGGDVSKRTKLAARSDLSPEILVYLANDDALAVRRAVAASSGHATLFCAPADIRAAVEVFQPQEAALAGLTARLKENFDPRGVLNPGRMQAGV